MVNPDPDLATEPRRHRETEETALRIDWVSDKGIQNPEARIQNRAKRSSSEFWILNSGFLSRFCILDLCVSVAKEHLFGAKVDSISKESYSNRDPTLVVSND